MTSATITTAISGMEVPPMPLEDSMCEIIAKAKQGEDDAINEIWDRYFPELVRLAGQRLRGQRRGMADEEDVAISVMGSFFQAAQAGRFPDLHDRDGIWRLLSQMTRRKAIDHIRRNAVRPAVGESALGGSSDFERPIEGFAGRDPTPQMAAIVTDQIEQMMTALPEKYHAIALKKLECLTVPEIARECGVHTSTVERRLRIIREFWTKEMDKE